MEFSEENEFNVSDKVSIKDDSLDMFRTDIDDSTLGFRSVYSDTNFVCFAADGMFHSY